MKIFVAIWEDAHSDVSAHVFSEYEEAIAWARKQAVERCRDREDYEEHKRCKDYLFAVTYSCGCISVQECEVDKDLEK